MRGNKEEQEFHLLHKVMKHWHPSVQPLLGVLGGGVVVRFWWDLVGFW
jgi:hypothetical protein